MDISRLKKKDLKVWLPLFDDVDVLCRHIPQGEFDAIKAAATSVRFDPRTHQRVEKLDDRRFRADLATAVVEEWRGLKDGDSDFPCTPENIEFMMQECTEFRLLVLDAPCSLDKMLSAEKAELEKNSETTSAPGPTSPA